MAVKRNISIEACRLLFMLQICLWHYGNFNGLLQTGYLGVEFFFMLSGIFLYFTASSEKSAGILKFTLNKVSKFYLAYIISIIFTYFVTFKTWYPYSVENPLHVFLRFLGELLLIQNIGISSGGMNTPLWFFSVLIYGSALVYGFVKYYRLFSIRILIPICILLFFQNIYEGGFGTETSLEVWRMSGILFMPFARGVVEISMGAMLGYLFKSYGNRPILSSGIVNILCLTSIIIYSIILVAGKNETQYGLICIAVILWTCLTPHSIMNRVFSSKIWLTLGVYTFDIFLIHFPLQKIIANNSLKFNLSNWAGIGIYLLLLVPCAVLFHKFVAMLKQYIDKMG